MEINEINATLWPIDISQSMTALVVQTVQHRTIILCSIDYKTVAMYMILPCVIQEQLQKSKNMQRS